MKLLQQFSNFDNFKITFRTFPKRYKTINGNYWHICEKLPYNARVTKIQIQKNGLPAYEVTREDEKNEFVREFSDAKFAFLDIINK